VTSWDTPSAAGPRPAALARDRYRCQRAGCYQPATDVHHLINRARGGRLPDGVLAGEHLDTRDPRLGYLLSLCHPCHQAAHAGHHPELYRRGAFRRDQLTGRVYYLGPVPELAAAWPLPPS
jgi:hypothetical protein